MEQPPKPSQVLVERLRELRRQQGMSAADLSDRIADLGEHLSRATISKIETGQRGVSLDEALLLAYALSVAPTHLICPTDERPVQLGRWTVGSGRLRAWVRGQYAGLGGIDERRYYTQVPDEEWSPPTGRRHATIEEMRQGDGVTYADGADDE